eukprot:CAMPEP_0185729496 /NCGR_PEP_ID=MMETSP1171-20130828/6216_1 /TAXON_ID=374046 /ORGANISM="Helicotheca tamensis, Strain CCMP826" /LENGTH=316 /DNA_ID=CAMNT_0028398355 /DNA_START=39 /DNA_END=989 /DNA_ORIENTATION=+
MKLANSFLTYLFFVYLQTGGDAFSASKISATRTCLPLTVTSLGATDNDQTNGDDVSDQVLKSLTEKLDQSKESNPPKKKDNKAMAFLRKVGRVGGAANKSFVNAVGSDEGSTGRQPAAKRQSQGMAKSKAAYQECTKSGVVDDLSEMFPFTSSGTEWRGVSDRVMGGLSNGFIKRETDLQGKTANLLTGHVSLENNGGFIQMVTDLALDPSKSISVDASEYDGVELEVLCRHEPREFNVHLRTPGTLKQASYRFTCKVGEEDKWETVRIPFSSFKSSEDEMPPLDTSALRRIGIVAIGREMDVYLAVAGVKFYVVI